ncbi:MAG: cell envelope integrity EipB family protein [Alphaproteobacteria bacterium]
MARGGIVVGMVATLCLAGTVWAADPVPPGPVAPDPASHEAVYDVSLATLRSGSGVVGARGRMIYRFIDVCDGWTVETHNSLDMVDDQGAQVATGWHFVAWESKDGLSYRFRVTSTRDGETTETITGTARLDGVGQTGEARFEQPEPTTIPLPAGTLFPTRHAMVLVERAMAGERSVLRKVFDGTLVAPPFDVNMLLGRSLPVGTAGENTDPLVAATPSWRMHLAYFRTDTDDVTPFHEVGVRYHDNSVAEEVLQDYGAFSLTARVRDLKALPKPGC